MANFAFIFLGTGQDERCESLNYQILRGHLKESGYHAHVFSGIGVEEKNRPIRKVISKSDKNTFGAATGVGWPKNIGDALRAIQQGLRAPTNTNSRHLLKNVPQELDPVSAAALKLREGRSKSRHLLKDVPQELDPVSAAALKLGREEKHNFVCIGLSRGGVQALIMANILAKNFRGSKIFLFTMDPVPGMALLPPNCANHAFNISGKDFVEKHDLDPKTFSSHVSGGITAYCNILMQFKTRLVKGFIPKAGFTPLSPKLNNMFVPNSVPYKEFFMIGGHSDGGSINPLRPTAACTHDILFTYLNKYGLPGTKPAYASDYAVLEKYAQMFMQDQSQKFSFGKKHAERSAVPAASFSSATKPWSGYGSAGREYLINPRDLQVGFINERHKELWDMHANDPIIRFCFRSMDDTDEVNFTEVLRRTWSHGQFFPRWLQHVTEEQLYPT